MLSVGSFIKLLERRRATISPEPKQGLFRVKIGAIQRDIETLYKGDEGG
jgi:hypothetical protein